MNPNSESMEQLAARVSAGDERARARLRESLEPHMALIVRRALERGDPSSSVVRKIKAAAQRLGSEALDASERVNVVADNLRSIVLNRLWAGTECFGSSSATAN